MGGRGGILFSLISVPVLRDTILFPLANYMNSKLMNKGLSMMCCVGARESFLLTCSIIEPPVVYLLPPRRVRYYQEPANKDVSLRRE